MPYLILADILLISCPPSWKSAGLNTHKDSMISRSYQCRALVFGKAVRDGKWKIVAHGLDTPWELYHMDEDPTETNNLASMYPDIVDNLSEQYDSWLEENKKWN